MQLFKRHVSARSITAFVAENVVIFGSIATVARLHAPIDDPAAVFWRIAVVVGLCQLSLYYNDFYDLTVIDSNRELVIRLLQATGAVSIVLAVVYLAMPSLDLGNGVFVTSLALVLIGVFTWRLAFNRLVRARRLRERILIVGTGPAAKIVARQILAQREFGYDIVGFIDNDPARIGESVVNPRVVGIPTQLPDLISRHHVARIVVAMPDRRGVLPVQELMAAKLSGVRIEDAATTYERLTGKILIDDLRPSALIFSDGFHVSRTTRLVKRAIDLVLALAVFVVAAPLMLLTALAIRLESGAPVLYLQERVGENGRPFVVYKFRSMRPDAETGTPVWARSGDDRVTRVGRVIRKVRLDELPQLWNVLKGDMSFVGPRPERPYFVDQLCAAVPFYAQRHAVKPGLTGWAQTKYRYGASIEDAIEKLRYDLYYIKHMSLFFDLSIVFDTVKVILFGKGAQ
jgi:sugar transferase (PEP-CTERM system associated)